MDQYELDRWTPDMGEDEDDDEKEDADREWAADHSGDNLDR